MLQQRHMDIAASIQKITEEVMLRMAAEAHRETKLRNLVLAGGVALNCVMNSFIRDRGPFEEVWVQPAAGDAGTALGAALWIDSRERSRQGDDERRWTMDHAYLGPAYSDAEIEGFLRWSKLPFRRLTDIAGETAELLAAGNVIGWYQGRTEFGPRALGARSILASPIDPGMQAKLNEIKDREEYLKRQGEAQYEVEQRKLV